MSTNKKTMIVVHGVNFKEGYGKCIIDINSIVTVYQDSRGITNIKYVLGESYNEVEVKESVDDIIKKLTDCGVNIGGYHGMG